MPIGKPPEQTRVMRGPDALKQRTVQHVARLSLSVPEAPTNAQGEPLDPQLPDDITAVSIQELGKLYGQFMAVSSYAEPQVALADIEHTDAKAHLNFIEAQSGLMSDGSNQQERKWNLQLDPEYRKAQEAERVAYAKFTLLEHLIKRYEKAAASLSRELTRRGVEISKDI